MKQMAKYKGAMAIKVKRFDIGDLSLEKSHRQ